jgi:nucleoside 2-deoxyribosyltransferase
MDNKSGSKKTKKVYIAGPLFTSGERWYLEYIDQICRQAGFETYLPHRDAGLCPPSGEGGKFFFNEDLKKLDEVDLLVAVLNGCEVDSGTAWEVGYAYARGRPILGIYDDKRVSDPQANFNPMLYYSVDLCDSMECLEKKLKGNMI